MEKYLLFGKRATNALWEDENNLEPVIEAINDLEASLFVYNEQTTQLYEVLKAYSKWTDYAYLTPEQYAQISERV